ncbi:hypothetical protein IE53DRAFT_370759 [Violaceomyces palustris]|uniref:Uncharacterized protein n=1 Tax=Violaceomyces palustris TaxID=1673888 RepID=A0ACD0NR75_9BASI|nr:hypothetical protein IE53DRAFT_370759 [Violaceomyces palustris]
MSAPNDPPKATLYTFDGSVWASAPRLALIEKGYSDYDLDVKVVDLIKGENFSPSYLRINSKGTVPTLVVPILETTSSEVSTKFKALNDSKSILEFLDKSRNQQILDNKGQGDSTPAPVLAPATIEGKAKSDALIKAVHDDNADPNFLLLGARTLEELEANKQGLPGLFVRNRHAALLKYQAEVESSSAGGDSTETNPRSAAMIESLKKWYEDKIKSQELLSQVYVDNSAEAAAKLVEATAGVWAGVADTLKVIDEGVKGPFALGDQLSLADLHVIPWLARVLAVSSGLPENKGQQGGEDIDALDRALKNPILANHANASSGVSSHVRAYWASLKSRPSFQKVYADGLH